MRENFPADIIEKVDALLHGRYLDGDESETLHYELWEDIAQALLDERLTTGKQHVTLIEPLPGGGHRVTNRYGHSFNTTD